MLVVIYVDDLIDSYADIDDLKLLLKQKFEMKDLGELHYFFGVEGIRSPSEYGYYKGSMAWICYPNMG